jgi:hypothetical protein
MQENRDTAAAIAVWIFNGLARRAGVSLSNSTFLRRFIRTMKVRSGLVNWRFNTGTFLAQWKLN